MFEDLDCRGQTDEVRLEEVSMSIVGWKCSRPPPHGIQRLARGVHALQPVLLVDKFEQIAVYIDASIVEESGSERWSRVRKLIALRKIPPVTYPCRTSVAPRGARGGGFTPGSIFSSDDV
jgi:hypothetical protein